MKSVEDMSDRELFKFCQTTQVSLCNSQQFWKERFLNRYGFANPQEDWKNFYLQTLYFLDKSHNNIPSAIIEAQSYGAPDVVEFLSTKNQSLYKLTPKAVDYYNTIMKNTRTEIQKMAKSLLDQGVMSKNVMIRLPFQIGKSVDQSSLRSIIKTETLSDRDITAEEFLSIHRSENLENIQELEKILR